jgi:phosphoribosylaminoimidazole-succinocarboxamide synthase
VTVLLEAELPLPLYRRGKVRDTFEAGDLLLIVATDRISAFDVVLPNGIPDKGRVLNMLSAFWFDKTRHIIPNHMVELVEDARILERYFPPQTCYVYPSYLAGRSMVVRKAERLPVECVVRGYISGSAWAEYQEKGTIFGNPLPQGMVESQELPQPVFTPTTKAETGHDQELSPRDLQNLVGKGLAREIEEKSLAIYNFARKYARGRGIIVADTKFEFGLIHGQLSLIDELLTPDSSRFWDASQYRPGVSQPSFDKQPVRDWLVATGWNKEPPAPPLPPEVIESTTRRYREAYRRLTGQDL